MKDKSLDENLEKEITEEILSVDVEVTDETKKPKKGKVIVAIVVILLIAIGIYMLIPKSPLKEESIVVEYGTKISQEAKDYLKDNVNKDKLKKAEVKIEEVEVKKDKREDKEAEETEAEYEEVGKYEAVITFGGKKYTVSVEVKDTTAPKIKGTDTIILEVDTDKEEVYYENIITGEDLSDFELKFNDDEVDFAKEGEYVLVVTATDEYKNKKTKEVKIKITDAETIEEEVENNDNESGKSNSNNSYVYIPSIEKDKVNNNSGENSSNNYGNSSNNYGNSSSNYGNSSSNYGNSGGSSGGSSSKPKPKPNPNPKPPAPEPEPPAHVCIGVGEMGWHSSQGSLDAMYSSELAYWDNLYESGQITVENYGENCPKGYSGYQCSCGNWTGNYYR